jgi:pilus assembly protein Flp/PilA
VKNLFNRFVREDAGQDMIEYALVAGIIAVAAVASITAIRTRVTTLWSDVATAVGAGS